MLSLAEAAGKPLVVDEFNIQRPITQRNEGLQLIYGLLQNSSSSVAGPVLSSCSEQHSCIPLIMVESRHSLAEYLLQGGSWNTKGKNEKFCWWGVACCLSQQSAVGQGSPYT